MIHKILTTFILLTIVIIPVLGASSSFSLIGTSGAMSLQQCSSLANADGGMPKFGGNNTSQYTEDNSQKSILTNGRTYAKVESKSDQSSSNFYASITDLATDHMGIAEDTTGMLNIQQNEPASMCDSDGFLTAGTVGSSGLYPVSESYEGRTGAVFHDGGTYSSEVGLADGDVHLQGTVYSESKAIQYMNVYTTSKKGFDKNSTEQNLDTYEHINYVGTTTDKTTLDRTVTHDYNSYVDAFEDVLAEQEYRESQTMTSISADRVDETINGTTNESVNSTPIELPEQFHNESLGLAEISNQSIIRE